MTPWIRVLRATGVVAALGAGAVLSPYGSVMAHGSPVGAYGAESAPDTVAAPSASRSGSASAAHAERSRAGSGPGEGRERPGRREEGPDGERHGWGRDHGVRDEDERHRGWGLPEEPYAEDAPAVPEASAEPVPAASASPQESAQQAAGSQTEPVLQILPLGSGLVLIGLGLALALLGLRLRRT